MSFEIEGLPPLVSSGVCLRLLAGRIGNRDKEVRSAARCLESCPASCPSLTQVNEKEEYADQVAQELFENAMMRGLPYNAALAEAQKAMESAERHYEEVSEE